MVLALWRIALITIKLCHSQNSFNTQSFDTSLVPPSLGVLKAEGIVEANGHWRYNKNNVSSIQQKTGHCRTVKRTIDPKVYVCKYAATIYIAAICDTVVWARYNCAIKWKAQPQNQERMYPQKGHVAAHDRVIMSLWVIKWACRPLA